MVIVNTRVFLHESQFAGAVAKLEEQFKPRGVVHIRFKLAEDWAGDPAMYFYVLVKDSVMASDEEFRQLWREIPEAVWSETAPSDSGLFPHVMFRSEGAQARHRDPNWA